MLGKNSKGPGGGKIMGLGVWMVGVSGGRHTLKRDVPKHTNIASAW